ncbi:elongation factor Ts [Helicobacter monodelphidis]|uniref:translation elongation factor Ts n=1 Tax=Helicobacter sp. 15-1451 TaxID=2004995 RepID=UPI000DCCFCC6|nr:translation elongation factor Ts [Helicobacter sp. 15-1451]RAX58617.1 elongation factor Ts [Helicobacter sp. 15-1451]
MADISAQLVKELRSKTDAPMMDCKKVLVETNGDLDKAIDLLRERGLSKASKKADRVASEGVISIQIADDFSKAAMVEINSETDFVAKNETFQDLVAKTTQAVFSKEITTVDDITSLDIQGTAFNEFLQANIAKIGENLVLRRLHTLKADCPLTIINGYVHTNKRVGVLIALTCTKPESKEATIDLAKKFAMHAAAMKPQVVSYKEFDDEFIQKEKIALIAELEKENEELARLKKPLHKIPRFVSKKEITEEIIKEEEQRLKEELKAQNKPENIWERIIPGQIERFIADNTLLDQRLTLLGQFYIVDDKKRIDQILAEENKKLGDSIHVHAYIRFELGEGIEKQKTDFAAEVAAQMG